MPVVLTECALCLCFGVILCFNAVVLRHMCVCVCVCVCVCTKPERDEATSAHGVC